MSGRSAQISGPSTALLAVTSPDCPAPVWKPLEKAFHPSPMTIVQACLDALQSEASLTRRLGDAQDRFTGPY